MKTKSFLIFILSAAVIFLSSCSTKMTLEEAKKTSITISGQPTDVPQRRINDILNILDQPGKFDSDIVSSLRRKADQKLSNDASSEDYYKRGQSAWELGRYRQGIVDLRKAVEIDKDELSGNYMHFLYLCIAERKLGNFQTAVQLCEESLKIIGDKSTGTLYNLAIMYAMLGQIDKAQDMRNRLNRLCVYSPRRPENMHLCNYRKDSIDAFLLEFDSKFANAESLLRNRIDLAKHIVSDYPSAMVETKIDLALNLIRQKRFNEAEVQIRQALQEDLALVGVDSPLTIEILRIFGNICIAQGRINDAEKITVRAIKIGEALESSQKDIFSCRARAQLGDLLSIKGNFNEAMKQYNLAKEGLSRFQYQYDQYITKNPHYMVTLIMTNNKDEATKVVTTALNESKKMLGENDYTTALSRALLGIINKRKGNLKEAFNDYSNSMLIIESKHSMAMDYATTHLLSIIINDYIDLFAQIKEAKLEKELEIDASELAFKLSEASRRHSIQGDIAASSARQAITSPALAELVRKEQDAEKTINVLNANLSELIAAPAEDIVESGIKTINKRINQLREARSVIREEIKKNYPDYERFINPPTPTIETARKNLRKGEAIISFHVTNDKTYIWAIPYNGEVQFVVSAIGNIELNHIVFELRKSLDCNPTSIGDIPKFNIDLSYELYRKLLKPVEVGWQDAPDLLIVPSGAIGQLPLSVLLTKSVQSDSDRDILFDKYKKYPWLIKKASLTIIPSVSSLVILRNTIKKDDIERKAFIGFGDPIFSKEQLGKLDAKDQQKTFSRRGAVQVRGIRVSDKGTLDNNTIVSAQLENLNSLPDTAEELRSIAKALNADQEKDVLLGINATKTNVKTMQLKDRKIIAFATHALIPGDLDGLYQSALALTPSSVTGKPNDDGLLTMEDILKLNLNSDWVVLSACNTAAAEGSGAEVLTGLCRAFFYAGTKSVLATMYPVETTSAKRLVTNLFENQNDSKYTSRTRALQKSMLTLMENMNLIDDRSGKVVSSYAHPFFWAPFIIVGEPGNLNSLPCRKALP